MLEIAQVDVVAAVADARELIRVSEEVLPDVVLTDIQMPPTHTDDGLQAALVIRARQPEIGVLVLSQFLEEQYAIDLVAAGAERTGYLLKEKVGKTPTCWSTRSSASRVFMKLGLQQTDSQQHRRVLAVLRYLNS